MTKSHSAELIQRCVDESLRLLDRTLAKDCDAVYTSGLEDLVVIKIGMLPHRDKETTFEKERAVSYDFVTGNKKDIYSRWMSSPD